MQGSEAHAPLLVGKGSGRVGVDHSPRSHRGTVALHHKPCLRENGASCELQAAPLH